MRRTTSREDAYFAESVGSTRALRCVRMETLRAFAAHYVGQTPGQIGTGQLGDKMEIEGINFEFMPGPNAWLHDAGGFKITLMETCPLGGAAQWLRSFKEALVRAPGFVQGADAHHFVGASQDVPSYVALARGRTVTWFNHSNGFLLATGLAEVTKGGEHEIRTERFIHHETCHLYEGAMVDWLRTLGADVDKAYEGGALQSLASELNFQYLPDRIQHWREHRTEGNAVTQDEDMASEFLVETYAHVVVEGKQLAEGRWPALDAVMTEMRQRKIEHPLQSPDLPPRVMRLPAFIEVPADLQERERLINQNVY